MNSSSIHQFCKGCFSLLIACCLTQVCAQTAPFRFAQLTDLHVSPKNAETAASLLACIAQINQSDSVDFVLITGDLTEEGDKASLQQVKELLGQLKVPCYTIMGNHETKWSESGCTAFSTLFGGERFQMEHNGVLFMGFNSGPLMRMALGHVSPQDIHWMVAEMEQRGKEQPTILVTHYPMLPGDVDNYYEVTDAVRRCNVRLFIGGHYHSYRQLQYDGIPGVLTRSSLHDKLGKSGYGLFEVSRDSVRIFQRNVGEPAEWKASIPFCQPLYDPQGRADKYPDYSVNQQYPKVKTVWNVQSGTSIYCAPTTDGKRLFVADDDGRLTAYGLQDGKKLWQFAAKKRIVGAPGTAQGVVVFGSADSCIYGVETTTGQLRWKQETNAPVLGAVAIAEGTAYIGGSDGGMRAIRIADGTLVWVYKQVKGYIETRPLITRNKVIFGAWDNTLYALERHTGQELWRWTGGLTRMHFSPATVWPAASQEKLFIVDPQRALTAIDIQTGRTIYRTYQSQVRESMGISQDRQRIYGKTMNDSIVCYDTRSNNAHQLWATNIGFGYEHAPSMPQERDGILYGGTKEGLLYAVEGKSGHIKWLHKVGNSLINTLLPLGKGKIAFTSTDGQVGILNEYY